jgi:hypothetical protein
MRKLQPPKVKGVVNNLKKQTTEHYKADSWTPKSFFVCCDIAVRVLRRFVEFQVELLQNFKSFKMDKK